MDGFLNESDLAVLEECLVETAGLRPVEGYWTVFTTCAWIVSRDDQFIAGVQAYEDRVYASRGGPHSAAAWSAISTKLDARYGRQLLEALQELKSALTSNQIQGGIATAIDGGAARDVERREWTKLQREFVFEGVSLLPGLIDFHWPAEEVRHAFPATEREASEKVILPSLPASAKPNHRKHESYAHQAASLVRKEGILPQAAFRRVKPEDNTREEASVLHAIRSTYELMYDRSGNPLKN